MRASGRGMVVGEGGYEAGVPLAVGEGAVGGRGRVRYVGREVLVNTQLPSNLIQYDFQS